MDVPIIGYVRISDNLFVWLQVSNSDLIWTPPPIFFFFLLNFTRILQLFCDLRLTLFDIPKELVLAKILVLSSVFDFPVVNWVPKWTRTVNFGCAPFEPKFKNLKDFSNAVFVLSEGYLWSRFQ